jgi:rRNA methylases
MIEQTALAGIRRIASRANPRVKTWASLKDKQNRDTLGLTLAEGVHLVEEGLRPPEQDEVRLFGPVAFLVSDSGAARPEAGGFLAAARGLGIELFNLADDCYEKMSGLRNSEGVALVMSVATKDDDIAAVTSKTGGKWLIATGVQDPGNAGALARTALAAGMDGCLFLDGADPRSPKFLRGSMGAAFRLPCLSVSTETFISAWPAGAVRLFAATTSATATDYRTAKYTTPFAILIGGERGIPDALSGMADEEIHIPLKGNVESLNLAVAAGILLFEALK